MGTWHDQREINRIYREWLADETILHTINSWERYTAERGWTVTSTGLIRTAELNRAK